MKSIAVYCGSNIGSNEIYQQSVKKLSQVFIKNNITLVYGGARVGLMGLLADEILNMKGNVIGVIPQSLIDIEVAHTNLSKLHVVNSMHERKKLMSDLSDGFILMPGGAGSLDEFFEIFTWRQLGYIEKPCGIFNVGNYFEHLIHFLNHAVREKFLKSDHLDSISISDDPDLLIDSFIKFEPIKSHKVIDGNRSVNTHDR